MNDGSDGMPVPNEPRTPVSVIATTFAVVLLICVAAIVIALTVKLVEVIV